MFDDPAEKFLVAIKKNDPAGIDSLLRRQEVNVDQVLKVYYTIWFLIFLSNFKNLDFGPFYESLKHENHQLYGMCVGFIGCSVILCVSVCAGCHAIYIIHMLLIDVWILILPTG